MANNIVTVNVSQTLAPAPSTLQRTAAFVSQGGTTLTAGSYVLLTQESTLATYLAGSKTIVTAVWASSVGTITLSTAHGITIGDMVQVVITGMVPIGWNGVFTATATTTTAFTIPLATNPGTVTTFGVSTTEDVVELVAMNNTFWAQGSSVSVYVLELGIGSSSDGITALTTFLTNNPNLFYSYLLPRNWSSNSALLALLALYSATTSKTYFFITEVVGVINIPATDKCAVVFAEAPSVTAAASAGTATEFSCAAMFWVTLNYNPSTSNQVTPTAYSFLVGVTPYPAAGNATVLAQFKAAGTNYVGTGAAGGISNAILMYGTTVDLHDFTYWYSVDWVQINIALNLTNEIINGSNNPQAPLYYNQAGINRLQVRAQSTMNSAIALGLALSPVTVTAVSFSQYVVANPDDYPNGVYNGLAVVYTPNRGFLSITFNVQVDQFPIT